MARVPIVQITSSSVISAGGTITRVVWGLSNDNKMYYWDAPNEEWVLLTAY